MHMGFPPRRKRQVSTSNPFGRKLSPDAAAARDAPRSVQQSLFSAIRRAGYEGSAASSIAWRLIKAVRPKMAESAASLAQVSGVPLEELQELRACVVASSERASMAGDASRAELVGDIVCCLDGIIARSSPGVTVVVDTSSAPADVSARRDARALELIQDGMDPELAGAQAFIEVRA